MLSEIRKTLSAAALLFFMLPLAARVSVTEGKIQLGNSPQLSNNTPAEFECRIVNPDSRPHRIMIRLSPGNYGSSMNSCSPEIIVPPRSNLLFRQPFFPGNDEKFTFSVFEDGVRHPNSAMNECSVKFADNRMTGVGILNDEGDAPGGFKQNPYLDRPVFPVNFRAENLPRHSELYRSLCGLIVVKPDFSKYTAEQFAAVQEYVMNGGLLIFADPEGTLAAASTPLAELLPVEPLGIRLVPSADLQRKRKKRREVNPHEIKVLDSVEKSGRKVRSMSSSSPFPLFQESRYGQGTVRVLSFAPLADNFPGDRSTADFYLAQLLNGPSLQQSFIAFREPLDRLTGFAVPQTETVRNLLVLYFAVLLVVLILGFRCKRHISAWLACTAAAIIMTGLLLHYVNRTLGKRGAMAAVLKVVNAELPGSSRNYISLYASSAVKTTVRSGSGHNLYEMLPFQRFFAFSRGMDNLNASPLDLRMQPDDTMLINDMNLAARSSRQIIEYQFAESLAYPVRKGPSPCLELSRTGLKLKPWKVPDSGRAEAVFVLYPNGSQAAELSKEGICTLKSHDSAIADPLIADIRNALEKSFSKRHPAIAVVSGGKIKHAGLDASFQRQGKTVTLYPAEVKAVTRDILIPTALLPLTPGDSGSRMTLDGGRLNTRYSIQSGMSISLNVNRSHALTIPGEFSDFKVKATISGSGRIEPVVKLSRGSGKHARVITGKKIGIGEYHFTGDEVRKFFSSGKPVSVTIEGVEKKTRRKDTDYQAGNWSLLDLQMELRGKTEAINKENDK